MESSTYNVDWRNAPNDVSLSYGEAHVWRAHIDKFVERLPHLTETLSSDERQRADRFRFERDRLRFIVALGILRTILGQYLNIEPSQLCFEYSVQGKPIIDGAIRFNLSHSDNLVLYAFTRQGDVGIDVELVRPIAETDDIVKRFFSASEHATIDALIGEARQRAFFEIWTRREAQLKARGIGLPDLAQSIDWTNGFTQSFIPADGYIGAIAFETAQESKFTYFEFQM